MNRIFSRYLNLSTVLTNINANLTQHKLAVKTLILFLDN